MIALETEVRFRIGPEKFNAGMSLLQQCIIVLNTMQTQFWMYVLNEQDETSISHFNIPVTFILPF